MIFTLPILASLLPFTLAAPAPAPFAFTPPPPTNEQWQAAAKLGVNVNSLNVNTGSGSGSAQAELLRDAAIFSQGRDTATVPRSAEYIKVRRQREAVGAEHIKHAARNFDRHRRSHGHAGNVNGSSKKNRKRACAAKDPNAPVQQPVLVAQPSPTYQAEEAMSSSPTSASASAETTAPFTELPSNESPAPESGSNGAIGGAVDAIFPVHVNSRWTTAQSEGNALSFSSALTPLSAGRLPSTSTAPDGSEGLHASFPAGTFKLTNAGFSFYSPGPANGAVDVQSASEVTLSYSVFFPEGFDFVKGGKLPGLYGGASMDEAKSCSGGRQDNRGRCFSARLMWRTNGMGEFYNYFPTDVQQGGGYCEVAPMSHCDAKFGDSIGRGSFYFNTGSWTTVTQRLKLNSPASESNGEQELWVDGKPVMNLSGLRIRTTDETKIYGIMAQTFFGGGDDSWATPRDQDAWFKDWSLGVVA